MEYRKTIGHVSVQAGCTLVLVGLIVVAFQFHVAAANSDIHFKELMAGANGNSRIQFIVIEQPQGQNLWGPQVGETESRMMLVFYDYAGRETGKFKFPANPPTGGTLQTLIATPEFAAMSGAPVPDVVIPPLLAPIAGKVCFRNNPANRAAGLRNECVSYGSFPGNTEINRSSDSPFGIPAGGPAASLPIINTVSLRRTVVTGQNADFRLTSRPTPMNIGGESFAIPLASSVEQGSNLFNNETFSGNGRTCATCHVANDNLRLSPGNIQTRFATLPTPAFSFDPLFIGEFKPSSFDAGFDFNLNTLVLAAPVDTAAPCTGELRGDITTDNGAHGKVLARVSPTTYLVFGGFNPKLTGVVTDGICSGTVSSVTAGDLAVAPDSTVPGLEDPKRMRTSGNTAQFPQGRGLILENIDGFSNPPVFRKSPHLLNLSRTGPFGFGGDIADLQTFVTGAVKQHFPRTLARNGSGPNPDFRLPTPDETAAMEAFMRAQEFPGGNDPNKFDLDRFATTLAQRQGRSQFFGTPTSPNCSTCHGGATLSQTTLSLQGKPIGVNASFNTGASSLGVSGDTNLPCEPSTANAGTCNSREFSVPSLFNVNNLGPFFHNASVSSVSSAVSFYNTSTFAASPADNALAAMNVPITISSQITSFLIGLSVRPYTMTAGPFRFGLQATNGGPTAAQTISITNTSSSSVTFFSPGCFLTGIDSTQFVITSCPLTAPLAAGQTAIITVAFDPNSVGLKSATLELNTAIPSGVDLFGVGDVMPPAPTLTGIVGTSGTADGGDAVTLTGSNFLNGATVTIGGAPAGFIKVVSPVSISARTGPHAPGAVDVVVTNPDGQTATMVSGYNYTAAVPLSLTSVAPSSGSSLGSSVTINGAGFQGGAVVMFGGLPASAINVLTSTTLTATAPPHAAGTVDLCVMNPDTTQACAPNAYTYVAAQAPVLSAVSPTSGSYLGGFDVILQGANFAPGATVLLGGSAAAVITLTPTSIRARTGPHAPGVVDVVVMNGDGQTATRPNAYTFLPPTITSISPTSGAIAGGTSVTISGTGFAVGANVTFGGQPGTFFFVSPTSIGTVAPAHAAGSVDVKVTNPDGQTVTATNGYSYVSPTITSISPITGTTAGGTRVTVFGTAIGPGASVTFGGVVGSNLSSNETSITATTPPHAAGAVDLVVTTATGGTVTRTGGYTYTLPTISSVFPNAGGSAGGTSVSISGSGFAPGATVTFGGASALNVFTNNEGFVTATTPAHSPGVVDVVVMNPDGNAATRVNGFTYLAPTITSVSPSSGSTVGGTSVTINGGGFVSGAIVSFDGQPAVVVSTSDSQINVRTPAHIAGSVNVVVTNPNGNSVTRANGFTYVLPSITFLSNTSGSTVGGTSLTINGAGFGVGATVTFGGTVVTNISISDASIFMNTPPHAAGIVDVVVTNVDGSSVTRVGGFTYALPKINSISPVSGNTGGGTFVQISGFAFAQGATVTFGGLAGTNISVSGDSFISVSTPAHAAASVDVVVTNVDGSAATRPNGFTYGLPAISSISPSSGTTGGGTFLQINGSGFAQGATVTFGGQPATNISSVNDSFISATTPAHSAGAVDVVVTNPNGTSTTRTNGFNYILPTITSTSPNSGTTNGGTQVSISGTGFAQGIKVTFGGLSAGTVTFFSETSLSVRTPAHAAGSVDVMVTNLNGTTATLANGYTYVLPTITSLTPNFGNTAGGTSVTVFGAGFADGASVTFGGALATNVFVNGGNQLTATTPSHAAGNVNVVVTNPNGSSATSTNGFTYVLPSITSISPSSGNTSGGTFVSIIGTGFSSGATVTFAGVPATNVSSNETSISASTPAHAAGSVDVVVTISNGASVTRTNGFTYILPSITSVSPNSGNTGGGTSVTINGAGFSPGATVTFGGVMASGNFCCGSETSISIPTPAHAAGAVNVVVTNTNGASAMVVNGFTYVLPTITSVSPISGSSAGGTFVSILGSGFGQNATITFGGTPVTSINFISETNISLFTPAHATGVVDVVVTNPNGTSATSPNAFTYLPAVILSLISPSSGSSLGATAVTITGSGFAAGATVKIGGVSATNVVFVSSTSITAVTGPHPPGLVDVLVTNSNSSSGTLGSGYAYVAATPPQVTSISPPFGSSLGGTAVTVGGSAFVQGASVRIGGVFATNVVFVNSGTLTAVTGARASGIADVEVINPDSQIGTLVSGYAYTAATGPTVSAILPASGSTLGGTALTISGTGFATGVTLTIGGQPATNVTVVNSTTIMATTGARGAGVVDVVVNNPDSQSATLAGAFTYAATPSNDNFANRFAIAGAGPLTATGSSISATAEPGEPSDQIGAGSGTPSVWWTWTATCSFSVVSPNSFINTSGSGFDTILGVFTGTNLASLTPFASDDDTGGNLASMVPSATPGPSSVNIANGTVFHIRVRGFSSSSMGAIVLHIDSPCGISGVSPASGSYTGGASVTVTGAGFANGATVAFGGVNATGVTVMNSTTITATTPAHVSGAVEVTVTNPNQTSATLPNAFTFTGGPKRPRGQLTSQ